MIGVIKGSQSPATSLESGDYLPPARLTKLIALLWLDASQDNDSEVAGYSTLAKHHTQEFGLLKQLPSTYQLRWRVFSVRKRSAT